VVQRLSTQSPAEERLRLFGLVYWLTVLLCVSLVPGPTRYILLYSCDTI